MIVVSDQARPERPPTSGPGSGAAAWRGYAAAVTDSPVEQWGALSREEIIELLDAEGDELSTFLARRPDPVVDEPEQRPARRRSPVWMVPTDDGMVPERDLRQR